MANSSFMLGMVASIADKLTAMKQERDAVITGTGRDLVVLKASVVDAELEKLDWTLSDDGPDAFPRCRNGPSSETLHNFRRMQMR